MQEALEYPETCSLQIPHDSYTPGIRLWNTIYQTIFLDASYKKVKAKGHKNMNMYKEAMQCMDRSCLTSKSSSD
jgi:hypothetical protein